MSSPRKQNKKVKKNAFGATAPPFIDYLKEILRRYPDGGQILKELIQNADDAEATQTVFIHDERRYGSSSVFSEPLGKYQGPALYAFNDAVFTEDDWKGIQQAGRSIKQEDPNKVGRFGIGFNSVYHVTDLPCVFSSKHLAVFDPQKQMFEDEREGYRWSLDDADDRKDLLDFTDQFKPFSDVVNLVCESDWENIINGQYFRGTLFRFPLRNEVSEISDNLYDSEKVTQLFDSFIPDADVSLLYLRHVSSISLIHIDSSGNVNLRIKVSSQSSPPTQPEANHVRREYVRGKTCFKTVSCETPDQKETKTKWLVTSCQLMDGHVHEIDELATKLSFYPQVDVAFQCDEENTCSAGRLSCFLPLPNNEANKTGLPVHINACFGLTDNRRHIKWQDEDQKNDESAKWNELLIKEVLPHVYLMIILDAIQLSRSSALPPSSVYKLWPDLNKTKHRPRWHSVARDVFEQLYHQEIFSLAKDEKIWVDSSKAIFPSISSSTDTMSAVIRLLIQRGENLVLVPEHVLTAVETFPNGYGLKKVTPRFVRTVLRNNQIEFIHKEDRLSLLEYVLSDGQYGELNGLQLLPLTDGSFRSFTNENENTALIDNEKFSRVLLPFCNRRFLPADLNSNIVAHLRQMAQTGLYKLINLDACNVAALAKENLPRDWKETQGHVTWNSAKDNHPPKTWLKEFWKFLNTHWDDLSSFVGMPLIPVEPIQNGSSSVLLARLERKSTLIFQSSRESSLSGQIQNVIKTVGGTVIRKDECLRHHEIERYVLTPSPKNVLQVLLNCNRHKVISGITSSPEKEEFKTFISCLDCLSDAEKNLLSVLPVFRLMSGRYVSTESKKAVILKSNPAIPSDLPVPDTIIQCANEAERRILTLLKVDLLDAAQLAIHLVECIERRSFQKVDEQKIMTWILNHGNLMFIQNSELLRKAKNLSFMQTERGECKRPSDVFDPTNKVFLDLFEDEFFPPQIYRTPVMLESLKQLGLKTKESDLSSINVCHVASQIQKLSIHSGNEAFKKADVLVKVLNRNDLLSQFSQEEIRELLKLQWVPCDNPDSLKSKQKRGLFKPNEVRSSKYSQIVGHVMPLTSELTEHFCQKLGLSRPPPAEKVLENLRVLTSLSSRVVNPDSNDKFKKKLHSTYKFMQENVKDFRSQMNKGSFPWIWCQTQFVSPQDVVMNYPADLDLSLYIKKVPEEFLKYAALLEEFGVKKEFPADQIESILHKIKERIDARLPPHGNPTELKVSIAILDWMRKNQKRLWNGTPVPVRAPKQTFTLQAWEDTVFCDISDEGLDDLRQDQETFHVIHEEVLPVTAKWLKIPFLSTRILKPQIIGDDEDFEGIEQCGQSEPITQRIKNILKEYDEENDIFKELIQNAEDAGASHCGFLLDFREHPSEGLIDEGMALSNGPCLWAYNNELFSEEDWKNIVSVGAASKESKIEKIGKFGLGFNAVYHLTDIPSILSGQHLLILDPNVTHLKKHIKHKTNPGIKLNLFQGRLFRRFPGQFKPYQGIFDCDLSESNQNYYKGTLIKLPFRTTTENSEISSKVYNKERISAFQKHLTDNSQTPLLFLKHVNALALLSISDQASTPPKKEQTKTLLKISREVVSQIKISKEMHHQDIRDTLENLDANYHEIVDSFAAHIDQIVCKCADNSSHQYWLLYSCLGAQHSLQIFQAEAQQCSFSLPVGGVAVPLRRESQNVWAPDQICSAGQAFCFLPLPIKTGLPVHINGSFAVTSNRKALWASGPKLEWNKALLQDAVTTAYITTLLELKKMAQNKELQNYAYYMFWPDVEKVSKAFQPLVEAFYSAVVLRAESTESTSLELFSNDQTWCSFDKARFLDLNIQGNKTVGKLAMDVFLKYAEPSYCAIPLPNWVRINLNRCGFSNLLKERTFHWVDFYQVVFKNLKQMDPRSRNALILNALDLNDRAVDELLKSHPCIPVQKVGALQFISKLVHPQGRVACLYEPEEGHFPDSAQSEYFNPKRIQRLLDLGMMNDTLPLEEVIERAKTIPRVWAKDKAQAHKRLQCLFECMRQHCDAKSPRWETLKHISFLPTVGINRQNTVVPVLKKPSEVYSYFCYDLVSLTEHTVSEELDIRPNNPVLTKLGVNTDPPIRTVLKQIKGAHERSDALDKSVLLRMASRCYEYLNKHLLNDRDPTAITEHAHSVPFVFIEDRFVNVRSVAMSGEFEEKPYLHILPQILSKYKNLWTCVGINDLFTTKQFVAALHEIKALHSGPLPTKDLHICLSIVGKGLYEAKDKNITHCLLPDERGVLRHSRKLYFNDSPWIPVESDVTLCHKLIPRVVACRFGVTTTRHHTLQKKIIKDFFEFGQQEKLTVRIKNIIDAYPAKKDILKELIQNADDAEATEIHFIWDKRKHGTKKIFGEKWKLLQGPALCVYNNKKFTDEDLRGIQQVGEGGKHGTLGRTGKYGLGFNTVYQLTDCPSLLTGDESLCIFDPNLQYVEFSTKESPGCMCLVDEQLKESFKDIYRTFLPDKFGLDSGTMFRLPLRSEEMAYRSEISKNPVEDEEISELFQLLQKDSEEFVLFLKHIKTIHFYEINNDGRETNHFLIEKQITKETLEEREHFQNHVRNSFKTGMVNQCQAIYKARITAGKEESHWVIAERYGSYTQSHETRDHVLIPQAALAARVGLKPKEFQGKAFCCLPLPGETGLPVHVNGNFELDFSRRDLWKEDGESAKTDWNQSLKQSTIAPLYADLLNHLCTKFKKGPPNKLVFLKSHLDFCLVFFPAVSKCDKVWQEMINEVYRTINQRNLPVIPTLRRVADVSSRLPDPKYTVNWSSVSKPDSADSPHFTTFDYELNMIAILEHTGMNLVPSSLTLHYIRDGFKKAGVKVAEISPSSVMNYLKKKTVNDPSQTNADLPLPVSQTLIRDAKRCKELLKFCLSDDGLTFSKDTKHSPVDLNGLPLLLTQDQMLRKFSSGSPRLISKFANIFLEHQSEFADFSVNLTYINMLEEGKYIKKLTIPVAAKFTKPVLKKLLQHLTPDERNGLHAAGKETLEWLRKLWEFFDEQAKPKSVATEPNQAFSEIKEHFSDSPIVPVIYPNRRDTCYLQTIKNLHSIVNEPDEHISPILIKLGFMALYHVFFLDLFPFQVKYVRPELLNTRDISAVLKLLFQVSHTQFKELSGEEADELQQALQSGVRSSQKNTEDHRMFKSLPLFQTVSGERQRIDLCSNVFVLKTTCQESFPSLYTFDDSKGIFLKHNLLNEDLSKILDIKMVEDLEYCVQFVLPLVHTLSEAQLLDFVSLLAILRSGHDYEQYQDRISSALRNVRFIRDIHGQLQTASYYYDKDVQVYKVMLPDERFVPEAFWKRIRNTFHFSQPKCLLIDLGLKHKVSEEEIVQFARQIESESARGNTELYVLQTRSSLLLKTALRENNENGNKSKFMQKIADIRFLFPVQIESELCDYHRAYAQGRDTVAIRGSLLEKERDHQYLIWTSMPILATNHLYNHLDSLKLAGACDNPPSERVVENIKNICTSLCRTEKLVETRAAVFRKSYAFLQSVSFEKSVLSEIPVVLVENDTSLVKASQTVLSLLHPEEFRPYLYPIQAKDALYAEFFRKVGVMENPTIVQLCTVLQEIYTECLNKTALQPNLRTTVQRAVQQIFCLLNEKPKEDHFQNSTLYLPSTDGKLYESNTLFFNDTSFRAQRLEESLKSKLNLLEKLNHCHLDTDPYEHQRLLQLLPESNRPKLLSRVISMKLVGAQLENCDYGMACEFGSEFQRHLSSQAFRHGLICLIREQKQGTVTQVEAVQMCENTFGKLRIVCSKALNTELWLDQEPLEGTMTETQVYVKKQHDDSIFYLKHSENREFKVLNEVYMNLTGEINGLLGNILNSSSLLVLGQLLLCDSMTEVEKVLESHGILNTASQEGGFGTRPRPGSLIPEEWHDCLDMDLLNSFEKGEYVGFSKDESENEYLYAIVVECLDDEPGRTRRNPSRYRIQIGDDEFIEVSSLDLYQFKREKRSAPVTDANCTDLDIFSGAVPSQERTIPQTLEEAKKEIDQSLKEIWKMSEPDKKKAIRRLFLKWHPDKNPDNTELATEACKYLQNRIKELESGRTQHSTSSSGFDFGDFRDFSDFFTRWNHQARHHRRGRERFYQNNSRQRYNFWSYFTETPRPDKEEAKRWFRQAQHDLSAAQNETENGRSPEWCLFKVHQAVEKALIATEFRRNGRHPGTGLTIVGLAYQISSYAAYLRDVPQVVDQLRSLGVDAKKTQYPNHHPKPHIPNEQFKSEDAQNAVSVATGLLRKLEQYVTD